MDLRLSIHFDGALYTAYDHRGQRHLHETRSNWDTVFRIRRTVPEKRFRLVTAPDKAKTRMVRAF